MWGQKCKFSEQRFIESHLGSLRHGLGRLRPRGHSPHQVATTLIDYSTTGLETH